jgi:hypothetical protein
MRALALGVLGAQQRMLNIVSVSSVGGRLVEGKMWERIVSPRGSGPWKKQPHIIMHMIS